MRILVAMLAIFLSVSNAYADQAAHEAAAKRLLVASQVQSQLDAMYDTILPQMSQMAQQSGIDRNMQDVMDRHMERTMNMLREEMNWEKLEPVLMRVYIDVYSEEELTALADFYESDVGQKFLAKTPEAMAVMMEEVQTMMGAFYSRIGELEAALKADIEASKAN